MRASTATVEVATLPTGDQMRAPVDVFYVHPTSYVGNAWNANLDDATVNAATDQGATRIQASAFNACCAIYAPRYRQANLTAFIRPSTDGMRNSACGRRCCRGLSFLPRPLQPGPTVHYRRA